MTVSNQTSSVSSVGNGVTTVFPFSFLVQDSSSIMVSVYDSVAAVSTNLVYNVDYTVTGLGAAIGGTVTYNPLGVPIPSTKTLTIARQLPYTQDLALQNQSDWNPSALETRLDKQVYMSQQLAARNALGLSVPVGSGLDPVATVATLLAAAPASASSATAAAASATAAAASATAAAAAISGITPGAATYLPDSGTADALVITPNPAISAYVNGVGFLLQKSAAANATTTPTVNVSGKGAVVIKKLVAGVVTALAIGELAASTLGIIIYSSANTCFLLGPGITSLFQDGTFRLQNSAALTKQAAVNLSAVTAGQLRNIVMPDSDVSLFPETTAVQYQANTAGKALTTDKVWSAMAIVTLTDAATIAWDMSTGIDFQVTLAGNRTLGNPTNTQVGKKGRIKVIQDATGSRTLAKSSNCKTVGGAALTLSTAANAIDYIDYDCVSATEIRLSLSKAWS
jgi:hypothetical protein